MKIIKPSVEFVTPVDGKVILSRIEECGRVCYKSEHKIAEGSAEKFCRGLIRRGHEAVLEHCSFTLRFICDRGVSHETRYCNYSMGQFEGQITVIEPCYLTPNTEAYVTRQTACMMAETCYFNLLNFGLTPQEARAVLPNSLKTEVVMTANIREWRHFFKLRCSPAAHPQMREVATQALEMCREKIPVLFDDIVFEI